MEELKIFLNEYIQKSESSCAVDDYFFGKLDAYEEILAYIINKENIR